MTAARRPAGADARPPAYRERVSQESHASCQACGKTWSGAWALANGSNHLAPGSDCPGPVTAIYTTTLRWWPWGGGER